MKKLQFILTLIMLITISEKSTSQSFTPALTIPVTVNGNQIVNPWAGGLNSPQFSEIDLNGDGVKDLFVFEPFLNGRITTYINTGTPNQVDYHYAPQYISKFPQMHDWALLRDYNCDGKEDIFTYNYMAGITVYKNISVGSNLQFTLYDTLLYSVYFGFPANLYIASNDLASFTDADGDGDVDILTMGVLGGIEFHRNYAMENFATCDTLVFQMDTATWGGFNFWPDSQAPDEVLAVDNDSDGDLDIFTSTGSSFYDHLFYYENTGSISNPNLVLMDDSFPSYNIPVHVINFMGTYYLDVNNDTKKDLLIAPFYQNSENIKNIQYYQDTASAGTNNFNLVNHNFLGDNMIDAGEGANVKFFDADMDGLQDLIIGNYNRTEFANGDTSSLSYYRNTGTAINPAFEFVTNNFANTNTTTEFYLVPAFGDLDGDGDEDMIIGMQDGTLKLYTSTSGNFSFTTANYQSIDVGNYCAPYLFDINQDGFLDLICGNKLGKISYYQNTGTLTNPVFTLINNFWGGVTVIDSSNSIYGYSYPFIYNKNGSLELLAGSERGFIYRYGNFSGNLNGIFTLIDTLYGNIYEPVRATVAGTDINGDGLMDYAVGNYAGGLTIYTQNPTGISESDLSQEYFNVFPNPNAGSLTIEVNIEKSADTKIILENLVGQRMFEKSLRPVNGFNSFKIDLNAFDNGIYFLQLIAENKSFTKKIVIQR